MIENTQENDTNHFKNKDALSHVVDAQAQGLVATSEIHGTEIPGHLSAGADAAREIAVLLAILWTILTQMHVSNPLPILWIFTAGWSLWKLGRSAWLAWSRLERLHRILEQERWEIIHHRQQERSELKELYAAKGFEGKLLEDVLDVLMADDNRLLRVMVEEELGLSLETQEHPLKQGVFAFLGVWSAAVITLSCIKIFPEFGLFFGATVVLGLAAGMAAYHSQNRIIPAAVWNIGLGAMSFATSYYLLQFFYSR